MKCNAHAESDLTNVDLISTEMHLNERSYCVSPNAVAFSPKSERALQVYVPSQESLKRLLKTTATNSTDILAMRFVTIAMHMSV